MQAQSKLKHIMASEDFLQIKRHLEQMFTKQANAKDYDWLHPVSAEMKRVCTDY